MTFTYTGDPSASDTAAVRFELQDISAQAPLLSDEEIDWAILQATGSAPATPAQIAGPALFRSAAACMLALARRFAAQADTQLGQLKVTYKDQAIQYGKLADALLAKAAGSNAPYAGGLSISEKQAAAADPDAVQPAFTKRQFDNRWAASAQGDELDQLGPPST